MQVVSYKISKLIFSPSAPAATYTTSLPAAPFTSYAAPATTYAAPAATYAAPAPVTTYAAPATYSSYSTAAPVTTYAAPNRARRGSLGFF